jgi:hypothetical protein
MKKQGNPQFGHADPAPIAGPTSFEHLVETLGLSRAEYESSATLRDWVSKHKNSKYVPPALLAAWGFTVD